MHGKYRISAGREAVWEALNEPSVLQACLEGCESFDRLSDTDFKAKMTTKVGPIKTRFSCSIQLSDLDPPNSYTLSGQGNGGAAGHARGTIKVSLAEGEGGTVLHYSVDASLRGKIGQLGARVVDNVARSMADKFFGKLSAMVDDAAEAVPEAAPPPERKGLSWVHVVLIVAAIGVAAIGWLAASG